MGRKRSRPPRSQEGIRKGVWMEGGSAGEDRTSRIGKLLDSNNHRSDEP
jgi:hypothetical protein